MSSNRINWFKYSSPATFYPLAGKLVPWFSAITVILIVVGLYMGFFVAPTDYKQGEGYRIIFVHVPASWMSMFIYLVMAFWAALALWTGAFWGKPMWGTWWVWDARLTSELILFFLYIGYIALHSSIDDKRRADRATAILVLVGVVNIPIIYYSVKWWNTLHQGASVSVKSGSSMASIMLISMLIMAFAFWAYTIAISLARVRSIILERERDTQWVSELPEIKQ